jgi:hypothetical protein
MLKILNAAHYTQGTARLIAVKLDVLLRKKATQSEMLVGSLSITVAITVNTR